MAKKPAAKSENQPEQKIQLVTPDFVPPRTASDDDRELYRRIVEEAKARGVAPDFSPLFARPNATVAPAPYVPKHYNVDPARLAKPADGGNTKADDESREAIPRLMTVLRITRRRRGLENAPHVSVTPRSATDYQVTYGAAVRVVSGDATISFLADLIAREGVIEKTLPKSDDDVVNMASSDLMNTEEFAKEFAEVAQYLSAEQKAKALERARYDARIGRFLAEINASENKPTLKRFAPVWWSLPEFLEKEWYAKGWIRPDVDRQMVEAYDTGLPGLITKWEDTNGLLPGHLRFAKVLNRSSKAERASKKPDITKS